VSSAKLDNIFWNKFEEKYFGWYLFIIMLHKQYLFNIFPSRLVLEKMCADDVCSSQARLGKNLTFIMFTWNNYGTFNYKKGDKRSSFA
jgi:hypothetical protein